MASTNWAIKCYEKLHRNISTQKTKTTKHASFSIAVFCWLIFRRVSPRATLIQIGHTHTAHSHGEEQIHRETLHHHFFLNCHLSLTFQKKESYSFFFIIRQHVFFFVSTLRVIIVPFDVYTVFCFLFLLCCAA